MPDLAAIVAACLPRTAASPRAAAADRGTATPTWWEHREDAWLARLAALTVTLSPWDAATALFGSNTQPKENHR